MVNISTNLTTFDDLLEGEKRDILTFQAGTHGLEDSECIHLDHLRPLSTLAHKQLLHTMGLTVFGKNFRTQLLHDSNLHNIFRHFQQLIIDGLWNPRIDGKKHGKRNT